MPVLVPIALFILLGLILYWQLIIAEGAYLGRRVVALLYDLVATRYNAIKQYDDADDARFLGRPLALSLQGLAQPLVLDVATGTSRLPLTLFNQSLFTGRVIALDNARRMLREATRYVAAHRRRVTWIWHHAVPLPFDDNVFDAVCCLEALEFMPDTRRALAECVRVLKPGGLLLVTNRINTGARFMPGKTYGHDKFEALLAALGQTDVTTQTWQFDYDLVWSLKPGDDEASAPVANPIDLLRCPKDRGALQAQAAQLVCGTCGRRYPIGSDGVVELL